MSSKYSRGAVDSGCWRNCGAVTAGHFHVFWDCLKLSPFWSEAIGKINHIMRLDLPKNFTVIYLGNIPHNLPKADKYLLRILLVGAKKAIARKWLCEDPQPKKTGFLLSRKFKTWRD